VFCGRRVVCVACLKVKQFYEHFCCLLPLGRCHAVLNRGAGLFSTLSGLGQPGKGRCHTGRVGTVRPRLPLGPDEGLGRTVAALRRLYVSGSISRSGKEAAEGTRQPGRRPGLSRRRRNAASAFCRAYANRSSMEAATSFRSCSRLKPRVRQVSGPYERN